jgi:hypothetical protein
MSHQPPSFAKLDGGRWGVRVHHDVGRGRDRAGEVVSVDKRDGSVKRVRLGRKVNEWNGRTQVYEVAEWMDDRRWTHE